MVREQNVSLKINGLDLTRLGGSYRIERNGIEVDFNDIDGEATGRTTETGIMKRDKVAEAHTITVRLLSPSVGAVSELFEECRKKFVSIQFTDPFSGLVLSEKLYYNTNREIGIVSILRRQDFRLNVGGFDMLARNSGFRILRGGIRIALNDADGESSGRAFDSGTMLREKLSENHVIQLDMRPLTHQALQSLVEVLRRPSFDVAFSDPYRGLNSATHSFYCAARNVTITRITRDLTTSPKFDTHTIRLIGNGVHLSQRDYRPYASLNIARYGDASIRFIEKGTPFGVREDWH